MSNNDTDTRLDARDLAPRPVKAPPASEHASREEAERAKNEMAQADFQRFMLMWDVDTDREFMDSDTRKLFDEMRRKVIREIKRGRFIVHDDYTEFFHSSPDVKVPSFEFREPNFRAMIKLDQYKEDQSTKRMMEFAGALTGRNPSLFSNLTVGDGQFISTVASVFTFQ